MQSPEKIIAFIVATPSTDTVDNRTSSKITTYNTFMSKNCYLCGEPTQTLERIHTPCLYAYLFPTRPLPLPVTAGGAANN